MDVTDKALVDRYRAGDATAMDALVRRHQKAVYGYVLNMTGRPEEADDIFQETWMKVIRKIDGYREQNFCGWLMRISRNTVIDRIRRRKPDVSVDAGSETGHSLADRLPSPVPNPASQAEHSDLGREISSAVASLPLEQREVFLMRMEADLPFKEIARIQHVSINTALARMQYALAKLRDALKDPYAQLAAGSA